MCKHTRIKRQSKIKKQTTENVNFSPTFCHQVCVNTTKNKMYTLDKGVFTFYILTILQMFCTTKLLIR